VIHGPAMTDRNLRAPWSHLGLLDRSGPRRDGGVVFVLLLLPGIPASFPRNVVLDLVLVFTVSMFLVPVDTLYRRKPRPGQDSFGPRPRRAPTPRKMELHPEETAYFSAFSKMRRIQLDPESVIEGNSAIGSPFRAPLPSTAGLAVVVKTHWTDSHVRQAVERP